MPDNLVALAALCKVHVIRKPNPTKKKKRTTAIVWCLSSFHFLLGVSHSLFSCFVFWFTNYFHKRCYLTQTRRTLRKWWFHFPFIYANSKGMHMESGGVGKRVKNISLSAFTSKNTCSNYFLTQYIRQIFISIFKLVIWIWLNLPFITLHRGSV